MKCLLCLTRVPRSRGVCPACYVLQRTAIQAGQVTDAELVALGQRAASRIAEGRRKFAAANEACFSVHRPG